MMKSSLLSKTLLKIGDPRVEDMHVHSTFSDGADSIEEIAQMAIKRGLSRILCVDHVRRDTSWLPQFASEVARQRAQFPNLEILLGVEAKMLDDSGTLDLPNDLSKVDFIQAADHQVPFGAECFSPHVFKQRIETGEIEADRVLRSLLRAMHGVMARYKNVIFSHPFSVLPKMGLRESMLHAESLRALAIHSEKTGALFEISESWKCPSERVILCLRQHGARFVVSTDSHEKERIGRYSDYCEPLLRTMGPFNEA
jgi:putative hydrolase